MRTREKKEEEVVKGVVYRTYRLVDKKKGSNVPIQHTTIVNT